MIVTSLMDAFLQTQSFIYRPDHPFTLASGKQSPFYVDCRLLLAHPGPRQKMAETAWRLLAPHAFDCIGGLEIGAIPMATAISAFAYTTPGHPACRTFVIRKQAKAYGMSKLIEGAYQPGDRALIVDDVLTSGSSLLRAITVAREAGLQVQEALVIVNRQEQDGRAAVEAMGVKVHCLLTAQQLVYNALHRQQVKTALHP